MTQEPKQRMCTICVRAGSKGIPGKNMADFLGKPLMAHSIEQALESGAFAVVAVSSDSQDYLDIGTSYGAHHAVLRPAELANDQAAKLPVIRHCVETVEQRTGAKYDTIVDLQVTSPLRISDDITGAISLLENNGQTENVITGCAAKSSPYFTIVERKDNGKIYLSKSLDRPVIRRQDTPDCFDINGSVYAWRRDVLFTKDGGSDGVVLAHTALYEMSEHRSIDIDTLLDFKFAEFVARLGDQYSRDQS